MKPFLLLMTRCLHDENKYLFFCKTITPKFNGSGLQITWESISYRRSPAGSSRYPADLNVTDSAAQPIASISLLHNDATLGTVHGLTWLHKSLKDRRRKKSLFYVAYSVISILDWCGSATAFIDESHLGFSFHKGSSVFCSPWVDVSSSWQRNHS